MKVIARPLADDQLEEAFYYYENQLAGLGNRFLDDYRRGLQQIAQFPTAWTSIDDLTRRYRLKKFPYAIHYIVGPDHILVTMIVHLQSDPKSWRRG